MGPVINGDAEEFRLRSQAQSIINSWTGLSDPARNDIMLKAAAVAVAVFAVFALVTSFPVAVLVGIPVAVISGLGVGAYLVNKEANVVNRFVGAGINLMGGNP